MDERSIPSTAIYGGSLARTFEYRTTGVHATPHLHWSFPLKEGATITCPVLVAEGVVYVGDSAGFFSALDARSGDLLWCFATDWAQNEENDDLDTEELTGVTAFCLAGRLGYVASAYQTLYEVDLSNGQVIRSWNEEALRMSSFGNITSLLFYDQCILFNGLWNDWTEFFSLLDPATGSITELFCCGDPIIYRHPRGDSDVVYGYVIDVSPPSGYSISFNAISFLKDSPLWWMGELEGEEEEDEEVCESIYRDWYTVMNETLYAVCRQRSLDETRLPAELRALDPFTGAVQWRYTIPKGEDPIHLGAASHLIFLVTRYGIEAVDAQTHQQRWKWTSNRDDRHVLIADGLLFVLDQAGQITALDASTGEQRWNWQAEQPIKGQFSMIADATLYLAMGHTLCAFR